MLQKYLLAVAVVIIIAERGNILVCTPDMLLLYSYLSLPHSSRSTGFAQCYTDTGCLGTTIRATNKRDCCVGTDVGLAFSDGGTCTECIGMY